MNQKEIQWDKLLKIKTSGRDDSNSDQYRYPYEPTPYSVLELNMMKEFLCRLWKIKKGQYRAAGHLFLWRMQKHIRYHKKLTDAISSIHFL